MTTSIIKWVVKVKFDDGLRQTLSFHPRDKRWKIFRSCGSNDSSPVTSPITSPNKVKAKKDRVSEAKSLLSDDSHTNQKGSMSPKQASSLHLSIVNPKAERKASEIFATSAAPPPQVQPKPNKKSFTNSTVTTAETVPDVQRLTSNKPLTSIGASTFATKKSPRDSESNEKSAQLARYITPDLRPPLPIVPNSNVASQASSSYKKSNSIGKPKECGLKVEKSAASIKYTESLKCSHSGGVQQRTILQSLFKNERDKAAKFVETVVGSSKMDKGMFQSNQKKIDDDELESSDGDYELELKMDSK